jgi:hypothetical protein
MCAVCRLRSEEVYIILAVSHPDLMLQSAGPLAIQSACEYTIFMATHSAEAASAIDAQCPPGRTASYLGADYPVPLNVLKNDLVLIHGF